jgi:altronate dehydratase
MESMSNISEDIFKKNFDLLVGQFRRYLHHKNADMQYEEGPRGTLQILFAINRLCSAKQGAKNSTPVFQYGKVILHNGVILIETNY